MRNRLRIGLVALLLVSVGFLGYSWATSDVRASESLYESAYDDGGQVVPNRPNHTAISINRRWQGTVASALLVFTPEGGVAYHNDTHYVYADVDPIPGTRSVFTISANLRAGETCQQYINRTEGRCTRNNFERMWWNNGTTETVYRESATNPGPRSSVNWHDADRLNSTHYLVADIAADRVFIVDVRTGEHTWTWDANQSYDPDSGGEYPGDWTHINDADMLHDGRVMASLRNQDSVVFIEPGEGIQENWTLGSDGDHDVMFEQHNPDYIPASRGGPAVLVADSENDRIVEYQRVDGTWEQSWVWSDPRLEWPRDADRLPNGNTLIVDSNGGRVIEVDQSGEVVWSVPISLPYDAERIGTGDESAGGHSATALNLTSRIASTDANRTTARNESVVIDEKRSFQLERIFGLVLPDEQASLLASGLQWTTPAWVLAEQIVAGFVALLTLLALVVTETVRVLRRRGVLDRVAVR